MFTNIFLIRHGEIVYPTDSEGRRLAYGPDVPLSESGKAQIQRFAERLQRGGHNLEQIYTSPFRRAMETAQILATVLKSPSPILVDEFQDISLGENVGKLLDDGLSGKLLAFGETHTEVAERMMRGLRAVVEQEPGKRVGIVSHGDPIRVAVFRLLHPDALLPSIGVLAQTDYLDKGEAWRIVVEPTTLHVVEHEYVGRPPEQWGRGERKS